MYLPYVAKVRLTRVEVEANIFGLFNVNVNNAMVRIMLVKWSGFYFRIITLSRSISYAVESLKPVYAEEL